MLLPLLLFLLLVSQLHAANILVTAPFSGSHYFAVAHLGQLLADQGHTVYLTSPLHDDRLQITSPNYHIVPSFTTVFTPEDFGRIVEV